MKNKSLFGLLSKVEKISLLVLLPVSFALVTWIAGMVDFKIVWLDMIADIVIFVGVPFALVKLSLPVIEHIERSLDKN